jgi:glycosyltransferase involved in cell wall biosynthesis
MQDNANQEPLITVTICTYNGENYLRQTLESVIAQTYRNIEIVIVDDGSTDNTRNILKEYEQLDARIKVYYQDNKGLAAARNAVFGHANGEWIAIIDQDDLWYKAKIEKQLKLSFEYPDADLIFSDTDYINDKNEIIGSHLSCHRLPYRYISKGLAANLLLSKGCYIDSESVFFRANLINRYGILDDSLTYLCDYEYFIRIGLQSNFVYTEEKLAAWRIHPYQATNLNKNKANELAINLKKYLLHTRITFFTKLVILIRILKIYIKRFKLQSIFIV